VYEAVRRAPILHLQGCGASGELDAVAGVTRGDTVLVEEDQAELVWRTLRGGTWTDRPCSRDSEQEVLTLPADGCIGATDSREAHT